jgi:hypothetical protein
MTAARVQSRLTSSASSSTHALGGQRREKSTRSFPWLIRYSRSTSADAQALVL